VPDGHRVGVEQRQVSEGRRRARRARSGVRTDASGLSWFSITNAQASRSRENAPPG